MASFDSVVCLWSLDIPRQHMKHDPLVFYPTSRASRSVRLAPYVSIRGHSTSVLDVNQNCISYFVHDTFDIIVSDWTFGLYDVQERRNKGVVMEYQELPVRLFLDQSYFSVSE